MKRPLSSATLQMLKAWSVVCRPLHNAEIWSRFLPTFEICCCWEGVSLWHQHPETVTYSRQTSVYNKGVCLVQLVRLAIPLIWLNLVYWVGWLGRVGWHCWVCLVQLVTGGEWVSQLGFQTGSIRTDFARTLSLSHTPTFINIPWTNFVHLMKEAKN